MYIYIYIIGLVIIDKKRLYDYCIRRLYKVSI